MKNEEIVTDFQRDGFVIVPGLFSSEEVRRLRDHYMRLRAMGPFPGDHTMIDTKAEDPLKRYPRMLHMHRWDHVSLAWLLDARLNEWLTRLLGREPFAVQTMVHFKPPGARGQALHQDQYYLRVQPGTCAAAWLALDRCDEDNGCMQVVPRSHTLPVLCTKACDAKTSFSDVVVDVPPGMNPVPAIMDPGDVLFFTGGVIHGSFPNTSPTRFRRALIGHYAVGDAKAIGEYYHPVLRMDGTEIEFGKSDYSGPCGVFVERDGEPTLAMVQDEASMSVVARE